MFWQLCIFFIFLFKKRFLYIMETTDIAFSYTANSNLIVYKMKAYRWVAMVQQHDTSQKPFDKLKLNLILGVFQLMWNIKHKIKKLGGPGQHSLYSDSLQTGQFGDQIPVGGEIFNKCLDWPWGPHSLLYNGYWVFSWGVKWPGSGTDHPSWSSIEVKERVQLYLYFPSGPLWPVIGWTLDLLVVHMGPIQSSLIYMKFKS